MDGFMKSKLLFNIQIDRHRKRNVICFQQILTFCAVFGFNVMDSEISLATILFTSVTEDRRVCTFEL